MVVHADLGFLTGSHPDGGAELAGVGPISTEVARRLACDAKVVFSVEHGDGSILDQKRVRRSPTMAQRIEIARRDKGCRFASCSFVDFTRRSPHGPLGAWRRDQSLESHHPVRSASSCGARIGMDDEGKCRRRGDVRGTPWPPDDVGTLANMARARARRRCGVDADRRCAPGDDGASSGRAKFGVIPAAGDPSGRHHTDRHTSSTRWAEPWWVEGATTPCALRRGPAAPGAE